MKIERKAITEFTVPAEAVRAAVARIDWARAKGDKTRPVYTGICLDVTSSKTVTAVATNGCALTWYPLTERMDTIWTCEGFRGIRAAFPAGSLDLKGVKGDVTIKISADNDRIYSDPEAAISTESGSSTIKLFHQMFPNWRGVVPEKFCGAFIINDDLRRVLRDAEKKENRANADADVVIRFRDSQVEVAGCYGAPFNRVVPADILNDTEEDFSIIFRLRYIVPMLKAVKKGLIHCAVNDSVTPVQFTADGMYAVYIPVRLR